MRFAGVYVNDYDIVTLTSRLRDAGLDATATKLNDAYTRDVRVFALTTADRESILHVLEEGPDEFVELREALLVDVEGRLLEEMVV